MLRNKKFKKLQVSHSHRFEEAVPIKKKVNELRFNCNKILTNYYFNLKQTLVWIKQKFDLKWSLFPKAKWNQFRVNPVHKKSLVSKVFWNSCQILSNRWTSWNLSIWLQQVPFWIYLMTFCMLALGNIALPYRKYYPRGEVSGTYGPRNNNFGTYMRGN